MRRHAAWIVMVCFVSACEVGEPASSSSIPPDDYVQVGDVSLHVLDWGGSGQLLLLVPGLSATAHVFDEVAPHFTTSHHVVVMTRRDHGLSTSTDTPPDLDVLADDIAAVIDHFTSEPAVLVGHSYAGVEIPRLAARHPSKVDAVVLVDAVYDWPGWLGVTPPLPGFDMDSAYVSADAADSAYLEIFPEFMQEAASRYVRSQLVEGATGGVRWRLSPSRFNEYLQAYSDWTGAEFVALKSPVLSVQADQESFIAANLRARGAPEEDIATSALWARDFDNALKSAGAAMLLTYAPQASNTVWGGTHHMVPLQKPVELVALIQGFLEALAEQ